MIDMKAKEYLEKHSPRGVSNTVPLTDDWHLGLDALCNYMEQYAKHSAQERYKRAEKYLSPYVKGGKIKSIFTKALKIASGLNNSAK